MKNKNTFYRFTVVKDSTLEEVYSIRSSSKNIYLFFSLLFFLFFFLSIVLLGYTPLRELVPGRSKASVQKDLVNMMLKVDSVEKSLLRQSLYTKNLKTILSDSMFLDSTRKGEANDAIKRSLLDYKPSVDDSILRLDVEAEESISLNSNLEEKEKNRAFFIKPVDGLITEGFNKKIGHFGIDVVSKKGAFISSIDDGMVLFSSWTHEFGYVLVIKHQNSFISFYKHNSEVFKSKGDYVKSGETIAIIGNSGKYSTGPHLHFELWKGSSPVNPVNYILF